MTIFDASTTESKDEFRYIFTESCYIFTESLVIEVLLKLSSLILINVHPRDIRYDL